MNKSLLVHSSGASPPGDAPIARVERAPSKTAAQGVALVTWARGLAQGAISPLVDLSRWESHDPTLAREVHVTCFVLGVPSLTGLVPLPLPGAMALITYQGQNGVTVTRYAAMPCDLSIVASQVRVQALAVSLPYQPVPQNCAPSPNGAAVQFQVACTIAEGDQDDWPSLPFFPNTFNSGIPLGSSLFTNGIAPLFYTQSLIAPACPGFLRGLQVTNATTAAILVMLLDAPSTHAPPTATDLYSYSSCAPIAVPSGATLVRSFDDLPFVWGPWVGAAVSTGAGTLEFAYVDATNVYVQADYAPIAVT